jgi:hypothetical protein
MEAARDCLDLLDHLASFGDFSRLAPRCYLPSIIPRQYFGEGGAPRRVRLGEAWWLHEHHDFGYHHSLLGYLASFGFFWSKF